MDNNFIEWIATLSKTYRQAQIKATIKVNSELLKYYLYLGKEINDSSFKNEYGSNFFKKLSDGLKKKVPNTKGFSPQNLRYCESFYILYRKIFQQVAGKFENDSFNKLNDYYFMVPWAHHIVLIDNFKDEPEKCAFYLNKIVENNWSRSTLVFQIANKIFEREGQALTNFQNLLPSNKIKIIQQITKDPYFFPFINVGENAEEKEIKDSLVDNVRKTLIELGNGFAFVDQEYHVQVGDSDFYIDLLFYHIPLHRYIVVEIKMNKFMPEYLGQLSLYVSAINKKVKGEKDDDTIGFLLCKNKDGEVAQYTLNNFNIPLGVSTYEFSQLLENKSKAQKRKKPTIK